MDNSNYGIVTALRACGPSGVPIARGMKKISYAGYRFPPEIIQQAIWLYLRFTLSLREVEDLLAERSIWLCHVVDRRTRQARVKSGRSRYAQRLRRPHSRCRKGRPGTHIPPGTACRGRSACLRAAYYGNTTLYSFVATTMGEGLRLESLPILVRKRAV